jgi:NAD(P)-dependent dehydrogenase (short-subunit alcohol dehydrogenase family)
MARNMEKLRTIAEEAGVDSSRVLPIPFDLHDMDSVVSVVRSIPKDFGRLRIVVNNAAEGGASTLDLPCEKFQSLLNVNLAIRFTSVLSLFLRHVPWRGLLIR